MSCLAEIPSQFICSPGGILYFLTVNGKTKCEEESSQSQTLQPHEPWQPQETVKPHSSSPVSFCHLLCSRSELCRAGREIGIFQSAKGNRRPPADKWFPPAAWRIDYSHILCRLSSRIFVLLVLAVPTFNPIVLRLWFYSGP